MNPISAYILSVVCTAVLCAVSQLLVPQMKDSERIQKLVIGLILTVTVMKPLLNLDDFNLDSRISTIQYETDEVINDGVQAANESMALHIIEKTQAYILDKAASMGAQIDVSVTVNEGEFQVPESVTIRGSVSPYVKKQLTQWIAEELQVPEELQIWI